MSICAAVRMVLCTHSLVCVYIGGGKAVRQFIVLACIRMVYVRACVCVSVSCVGELFMYIWWMLHKHNQANTLIHAYTQCHQRQIFSNSKNHIDGNTLWNEYGELRADFESNRKRTERIHIDSLPLIRNQPATSCLSGCVWNRCLSGSNRARETETQPEWVNEIERVTAAALFL